MKWKFLFILFSAVSSMSVYAEWKEINRFNTINSSDPETIGFELGYLPALQQQLLGFELSRSDKLVVSHLLIEYTTMKWENDDYCQVKDRKKHKSRKLGKCRV